MATLCKKITLMLWKQAKSLRHNKIALITQLVFPILLSIVLLIIKYQGTIRTTPDQKFKPFCPVSQDIPIFCNENHKAKRPFYSDFSYVQKSTRFKLLRYYPCHKKLDKAMKFFEKWFKVSCNRKPFLSLFGHSETFVSIEFEGAVLDGEKLPENMNVNIRFPGKLRLIHMFYDIFRKPTWRTDLKFKRPKEPITELDESTSSYYFYEGFLAVQQAITYFIIFSESGVQYDDLENFKPSEKVPEILLQRLPETERRVNYNYNNLRMFVNLFFMLMFVFHNRDLTMSITKEKQKQLKIMLTFLGVPNWMQWLAWFLRAIFIYLITIVCIVVILTVTWFPNSEYTSFFPQTKIGILFVFLFIYSVCMIAFCFMITNFFNNANHVSKVSFFLWCATIIPFYVNLSTNRGHSGIIFSNFAPNTAMTRVIHKCFMGRYLGASECAAYVRIMTILFATAVIFFTLALYFEVVASPYRDLKKKWYFLFTFCFKKKYPDIYDDEVFVWSNRRQFQRESINAQVGIKIKHLSKINNQNTLLDNISLNAFRNEITILLAHRGTGANELVDILVGVSYPTIGTVYIENYNVVKDMKSVRNFLGYCPESNVYFDYLTVKEHFQFFSQLRSNETDTKINYYMEQMGIKHLENRRLEDLDDNYIRRVCVALAFCGDTRVVILNRPTSNVVPETRMLIWKFIQENTKNRTVLVSTIYMDEAISLDGKIAILVHGSLYACGSKHFLNKNLGAGYYLVIKRNKFTAVSVDKVTAFVRNFVTNAELEMHSGLELHYILQKSYTDKFEVMFTKLNENKESLGISDYYITASTLEEIFLRTQTGHTREDAISNFQLKSHSKSTFDLRVKRQLRMGCALIRNQIRAMLYKNLLLLWREMNCFFTLLFIYVYCHLFYVLFIVIDDFIHDTSLSLELIAKTHRFGGIFLNTLLQADAKSKIAKFYCDSLPHPPIEVESIEETLTEWMRYEGELSGLIFMFGAEFSPTSIRGWFNDDVIHTPAQVLALILNAVYRNNFGEGYSISFTNKPMRFNFNVMLNTLGSFKGRISELTLHYSSTMALLSSILIVCPIKEIGINYKSMQFISGLKPIVYYLVGYAFNMLLFNLISMPVFILFATKNIPGFNNFTSFIISKVITSTCSFGYVSLIYFIAQKIRNTGSGVLLIIVINLWLGPLLTVIISTIFETYNELLWSRRISYVSDVFPFIAYTKAIKKHMVHQYSKKYCYDFHEECLEIHNQSTCKQLTCEYATFCCELQPVFHTLHVTLLITFCAALILTTINLMVDYKIFQRTVFNKLFKRKRNFKRMPSLDEKNSELELENAEIENEDIQKQLVVKHVTKLHKKQPIICDISFGIGKFGCVGLLGQPGSGKSLIMKMIVGELRPSRGEIIMNNKTLTHQLRTDENVGYFSQTDNFPARFTALEILKIHCLIKGIPPRYVNAKIDNVSQNLTIEKQLHKRFKNLDLSTKSLLKVAIAITGEPLIIVLDEPTCNIELSKRPLIRDLINMLKDEGRCIVLSSSDMPECTLVCNKIGIIVKGGFKCLGAPKSLTSKYTNGYSISIGLYKKTPQAEIKRLNSYMRHYFPNAMRRNAEKYYVQYYVEDGKLSCAKMFGILERAKKILHTIESYTISKSNLEKVFLSFTRYSSDPYSQSEFESNTFSDLNN